jgi:hypothetical protein
VKGGTRQDSWPLSLPVPSSTLRREWREGIYYTVTLRHTLTLQTLLQHLYALIPVHDNDKHHWVGGSTWLAAHPECELIAKRYLKYQTRLTRDALARLSKGDQPVSDAAEAQHHIEEEEEEEEEEKI